jgi:hypothetical protein
VKDGWRVIGEQQKLIARLAADSQDKSRAERNLEMLLEMFERAVRDRDQIAVALLSSDHPA